MPLYIYQHPETKVVIEVVQKMSDEHKFVDDAGIEWERVFVNPNMSMDTKVEANSEASFMKATANKKMSVGDLWEKSAELSEKRAQQEGVDPFKEKTMQEYEKKTKKKHPERKIKIETKDFIAEV